MPTHQSTNLPGNFCTFDRLFYMLRLLVLLLFLFPAWCGAQNLFINPGFENYSTCPDYTSQINRCTGWDSAVGTADYFNCTYYAPSTIGNYGIPRTGSGSVGVICAAPSIFNPGFDWYGEVFEGALVQTLIPGARYRLTSYWVSASTNLPVTPLDCYSLGFYFYKSANTPSLPLRACSGVRPQVRFAPNLVQVNNYSLFTDEFVADSCYDRVMIGLFCNDSTETPTCLQIGEYDYFNVDDIELLKIADAPAGNSNFVSSAVAVCEGDTVSYQNTSTPDRTGFAWNFAGGNPAVATGAGPHVVVYPNSGTFDVTMITQFECGTDTVAKPEYISILETPEISLQTDTGILCTGTPRLITAQSNASVEWSTGETGPAILVQQQSVYIATAANQCGEISDSVFLEYENCPCDIWIPNAFTPNGDNKNEIFRAYTSCILENYQLEIYDRYGAKIFSASAIDSGWDGLYNDKAIEGIYVAVIRYDGWENGKIQQHKLLEKVSLLR